MTCDLHPEPGPGLVAVALPRVPCTVRDPSAKHRIFRHAHAGTKFGVNRAGSIVFSVCVSVDGHDYLVPPSWVREEAPPESATILAFPQGGRRGMAPPP